MIKLDQNWSNWIKLDQIVETWGWGLVPQPNLYLFILWLLKNLAQACLFEFILEARAEIPEKNRWYFGRNDVFIKWFWFVLTFISNEKKKDMKKHSTYFKVQKHWEDTKIWKKYSILFGRNSIKGGPFFLILWPSHTIRSLTTLPAMTEWC